MSLSFKSSNAGEKVLEMSRAGQAPGHLGTWASGHLALDEIGPIILVRYRITE